MTDMINPSYEKHHSGANCALLNSDPGNRCWGKVMVVETIDNGKDESKTDAYLFACSGHVRKVKFGWREPYEKESKSVMGR